MKAVVRKNYFHEAVGLLLLFCFLLFLNACGKQESFYLEEAQEEAELLPEEEEVLKPAEDIKMYVQVCGAVKDPGVYEISAGSRIFEAVDLAGGMNPDADLASLNQAEILKDGQLVYVPTTEEAAQSKSISSGAESARPSEDGTININTASREQLMTLPGIGAAKADSILAYREEHGAFAIPEDLMKITGIKEGVFSKIKDKVKTN